MPAAVRQEEQQLRAVVRDVPGQDQGAQRSAAPAPGLERAQHPAPRPRLEPVGQAGGLRALSAAIKPLYRDEKPARDKKPVRGEEPAAPHRSPSSSPFTVIRRFIIPSTK